MGATVLWRNCRYCLFWFERRFEAKASTYEMTSSSEISEKMKVSKLELILYAPYIRGFSSWGTFSFRLFHIFTAWKLIDAQKQADCSSERASRAKIYWIHTFTLAQKWSDIESKGKSDTEHIGFIQFSVNRRPIWYRKKSGMCEFGIVGMGS